MSRKTATRLGALVAFSVVFALALGLYISGCTTGDIGNDLGLLEPGCRTPSACFVTGTSCDCRYGSVFGTSPSCRACIAVGDVSCTCNADGGNTQACIEPEEVCVGRAPSTCDGVGARCLHASLGQTCAMSGVGDPPDQVATGAGGTLEQRCPYVDDVCCPGTIPADGGTDGG